MLNKLKDQILKRLRKGTIGTDRIAISECYKMVLEYEKLFEKEIQKIPDICDEYIKHCNCKYSKDYFIANSDFSAPAPQNCKDCPTFCPNYKTK